TIYNSSRHQFLPLLYLHSFPTRRSSDLFARRFEFLNQLGFRDDFRDALFYIGELVFHRFEFVFAHFHFWLRALRHVRADFAMTRSEEHTSELQSPCNLVCRLLLEKKKTL